MPNAMLNNYTRNPAWKRIKEIDEKMEALRKKALALRNERIKLVGDVYGRGNAANSSAR
jgi:uncharacterized protein YaaR (DUF327 family)